MEVLNSLFVVLECVTADPLKMTKSFYFTKVLWTQELLAYHVLTQSCHVFLQHDSHAYLETLGAGMY